mmetsp:Transcript_14615/g.31058  ORF Transcript_14615/g.31058 Transcript_14615/m.31058 type:complete len:648 (-) Transcript_14615:385-2328(-)
MPIETLSSEALGAHGAPYGTSSLPQENSETSLEIRARSLLASSVRTIGDGSHPYIYPTPCESINGVVDSTATLIIARIFSKLQRSDLAWNFLITLFSAQGSNGFLPRYVYLNRTAIEESAFEGAAWEDFIGPYPGPKLFHSSPEGYVPQLPATKKKKKRANANDPKYEAKVNIWSSNTIMAPPYHATSILEIFYLSNQTTNDVNNLQLFYHKLLKWHEYLHKNVVSNCSASSIDIDQNHEEANPVPCITVRHPWETEIDMTSPLWSDALQNVTKIVEAEGWSWNSDLTPIPAHVKSSFDYPGDRTYNSILYLLQCLSDHGEENNANNENMKKEQSSNNEHFHSVCPFQMIDVGFTAALSKADADLLQIGQILVDKNRITQHSSWEVMADATRRSHRSKRMLHQLWGSDKGTFFNQVVNLQLNSSVTNSNDRYSSNDTTQIKLPIGSNFLAMWDRLSNSTMVESMSSQLLQHSGQFSFYCGEYMLWSRGCGESYATTEEESSWPSIQFLLNYHISKGLKHNKEVGLGHFVQSSTLNLLCGLPNSDESDLTNCLQSQQFSRAYNATSQIPLGKDECGLTSTLTAAIALDMLIADKVFRYESEPPISSSSVIVLIAMEMVVAFGIGVACLVLSLNLMRRAKADEEGDAFF